MATQTDGVELVGGVVCFDAKQVKGSLTCPANLDPRVELDLNIDDRRVDSTPPPWRAIVECQ